MHLLLFIIGFSAISLGNGQQPQPVRNQCMREVEQLSASCFQRSGLSMLTIDAVLTNGTIAPLPPNSNIMDLRKTLCGIRAQIIQCIVPTTLNMRGKPPCTDSAEFNFAENQVVRRLTALQNACGAGVMPQANSCMRMLDRNMQQCYTTAGLSPSMFGSNETEIKGAIIGKDKKAAAKFCGVRSTLFSCMRNVIEGCEGANEYMLLTGYDHASMEASIDLLCGDIDVYVEGLVCFQKPSIAVQKCLDTMSANMVDLAARQIQQNLDMDAFFSEYCKVRVEHLSCDMGAWKQSCSKAGVGLKNEFECTMLPSTCQKDVTLQTVLKDNVCNTTAFYKEFRQPPGRGSGSTFSLSTVLGSLVTLLFVMVFS
ncbi:uncharacterized protein LOC134255753 [Saccostrea cucullata]|uniref:uncharacterized protein LOC134255753 n=1 Tax=Saccostrea cuccullata TaxID=36930 RepID=UPI002ED3BE63